MSQQSEPDVLKETGRYEKVQSLGKGSFGFVQLARSVCNHELAAVKFLKRGDINKYVEGEIVNHSLLRHPHVIQFKEVRLGHCTQLHHAELTVFCIILRCTAPRCSVYISCFPHAVSPHPACTLSMLCHCLPPSPLYAVAQ